MKFAFANSSNIDEADAVLQGIPAQAGSLYGSPAEGPLYIRMASRKIYGSIYGNIHHATIVDAGDIEAEGSAMEVAEKISNEIILSQFSIYMGGDHSITYGIEKKLKKPLVVVDAHPDVFPGRFNHASFLRWIVEDGIIGRDELMIVGLTNCSKPEMDFLRSEGIAFSTSRDFRKAWADIPFDSFHLSIDMDALFQQAGSYQPEALGLLPHELLDFMEANISRIASMDIVELNPVADISMVSSLTAARIIVEAIGMKAVH